MIRVVLFASLVISFDNNLVAFFPGMKSDDYPIFDPEPMKIITLILSIYVLLMAVIPCCSFDNCEGEKRGEPQGICSPFFSCHNCSVPVVLERVIQITAISYINQPAYLEFQAAYLPGYTAACWNPPKA